MTVKVGTWATWHRVGKLSGPCNQLRTKTGRIFTILKQGNRYLIWYSTRTNPTHATRLFSGTEFDTLREAKNHAQAIADRLTNS